MTPSPDDELADLIPLDRWTVPLHEPDAATSPPALADDPVPEVLRFPVDADAPPLEGYQPRLLRFGRAG